MFEKLKGLQYGARIRLYQNNQRHTLDVGGKKVGLLRAGQGEPLLYLSSILGENVWLPFHQGLARDFEVIAPDRLDDDGTADWDDISFHYLDILDALELDRVHLVGVSLGAWEAAELALRYGHRVNKLVLANAFGLWIDDSPLIEFWKHWDDPPRLSELMLDRPDSFLGELLFANNAGSNRVEGLFKGTSGISGKGLKTQFYDPKLLSRLARIKSPSLVLWGGSDKVLPRAYAHAFHQSIPNSFLHLIENCGHLPMFEQEARFVSAVAHFLNTG